MIITETASSPLSLVERQSSLTRTRNAGSREPGCWIERWILDRIERRLMGYDVHITRAANWMDSKQHPILESEWIEIVHADPTLKIDTLSYSDRRGVGGTIERLHPVIWLAHTSSDLNHPCLWYESGEIFRKNPDTPTLKKMIEIARELSARVVGDEEEEYREADGKIQVLPQEHGS